VRFDTEFFKIFVILGCFEAPILGPFGTNRCKKRSSEKMIEKNVKKGVCKFCGENLPGGWGSLKDKENKTSDTSDIDSNTPWRALRHGGGYREQLYKHPVKNSDFTLFGILLNKISFETGPGGI